MIRNDNIIHERRIEASFSQAELETLLVNITAQEAGFQQCQKTITKVNFWHDDKGDRGYRIRADVTLVNPL